MRDLDQAEISRWTRGDADFSEFAIPTTDTAPWGEPGEIVLLTVRLDSNNPHVAPSRNTRSGTWDRDSHGLRGPMPTRRDPNAMANTGLFGMVSLAMMPGWMHSPNETHSGRGGLAVQFVVQGSCLIEDEDRMHALVVDTALKEINRMVSSLEGMKTTLDALRADDAEPVSGPRL